MTGRRHDPTQGLRVRIAPEVEEQNLSLAKRSGEPAAEARRLRAALLRKESMGTRATGTKKLHSLGLWEVRVGRHRLFFTLVPGTTRLAVGALIAKDERRIRMSNLRRIERSVRLWRDAVRSDH